MIHVIKENNLRISTPYVETEMKAYVIYSSEDRGKARSPAEDPLQVEKHWCEPAFVHNPVPDSRGRKAKERPLTQGSDGECTSVADLYACSNHNGWMCQHTPIYFVLVFSSFITTPLLPVMTDMAFLTFPCRVKAKLLFILRGRHAMTTNTYLNDVL